jgi:hypothetical protein
MRENNKSSQQPIRREHNTTSDIVRLFRLTISARVEQKSVDIRPREKLIDSRSLGRVVARLAALSVEVRIALAGGVDEDLLLRLLLHRGRTIGAAGGGGCRDGSVLLLCLVELSHDLRVEVEHDELARLLLVLRRVDHVEVEDVQMPSRALERAEDERVALLAEQLIEVLRLLRERAVREVLLLREHEVRTGELKEVGNGADGLCSLLRDRHECDEQNRSVSVRSTIPSSAPLFACVFRTRIGWTDLSSMVVPHVFKMIFVGKMKRDDSLSR